MKAHITIELDLNKKKDLMHIGIDLNKSLPDMCMEMIDNLLENYNKDKNVNEVKFSGVILRRDGQ
jgi:hypothetical protein